MLLELYLSLSCIVYVAYMTYMKLLWIKCKYYLLFMYTNKFFTVWFLFSQKFNVLIVTNLPRMG